MFDNIFQFNQATEKTNEKIVKKISKYEDLISTLQDNQDNKEFEYNNFMNETLISDINGTFFLTI